MATFNQRMKELRTEKNITLEDLAKVLSTTKSTLSRYENNLRTPNANFINQLAKYFDVSIDYLLGNTNIKNTTDSADKIAESINDDPELAQFWDSLKDREDLKLLFKQTRDIKQHDEVIKHAQAFMMDDKVGEKDKEKLVAVINKIYWDSKAKNKEKFGRKKKK
jgi:transcriptional regulator with XRE-family HTH domain